MPRYDNRVSYIPDDDSTANYHWHFLASAAVAVEDWFLDEEAILHR